MQLYKLLLLFILSVLAIIVSVTNSSIQNFDLSIFTILNPFLLCAALVVLSAHKLAFSETISFTCYTVSSLGTILFQQIELVIMFFELMSLSAFFIIAASCKDYGPAIRYACTHFLIGVLLMISVSIDNRSLSTVMIIMCLLMNCACFPFSFWVTDAYPTASLHGTSYLSLFTTKISFLVMILHTYNLWKDYAEVIATLGFVTTIYGIIFAIIEQNIRRFLCYGIIAQMGMLIFTGSLLANSEHAILLLISHIIISISYQVLLFSVANSIILKTKMVCFNRRTEFLSMEGICTAIAVLTMAAFPGTAGFVSKSYITSEIEAATISVYLFKALNLLLYASIGLKFIYYTFIFKFKKFTIIRKTTMLMVVLALNPYLFVYINPSIFGSVYNAQNIWSQFNLLLCATLLFIPLRKLFLPRIGFHTDIDWIFREVILYIRLLFNWFTIRKQALQNLTGSLYFNNIARYEKVSVSSASLILITILLVSLCLNH